MKILPVYFGCKNSEPGHFLWYPGLLGLGLHNSFYDRFETLDGFLAPSETPQVEGVANIVYVNHKNLPATLLAFWDRSVDKRPGSNSLFILPGTLDFPNAVALASSSFPEVWKRFTFKVVEWKPQRDSLTALTDRVAAWVRKCFGEPGMTRQERTARLLEEVVELSQSEGLLPDFITRVVDRVYARPFGDSAQEASGVAVCLLGWVASAKENLYSLALKEIERIEGKSTEHFRERHSAKVEQGIVTSTNVV